MNLHLIRKIGLLLLCGTFVSSGELWLEAVFHSEGQSASALVSYTAPAKEGLDEQLMTELRGQAEKRYIAPIDAQVDRVWRAIPGYNGLEVDIKASYGKSKEAGEQSPRQFVYQEVKPNVTLQMLPAQPSFRGNPNKPMAAIMINVAWGDEYIEPMLAVLKQEGVKATFFFDGSWLKKHPELAKKIAADGHELGNHAYTHPLMSQLSESRQEDEMAKTEAIMKATFGMKSKWFAPPSGDWNSSTVKIAHRLGMRTVLWTVDTIDWQKPSVATIIERVRNKIGPGSLVLMHPTAPSSQALGGIIKTIKQRSLKLGTVSETLSESRVLDGKVE